MTQKEMFEEIIKVAEEVKREDIKKFAEERIAAIEKKSTQRKPNPNAAENEIIKEEIVKILTEKAEPMNIASLIVTSPVMGGLTNQRVSYIANSLVKDGRIVKDKYKKYVYFYLPDGVTPVEFFENKEKVETETEEAEGENRRVIIID